MNPSHRDDQREETWRWAWGGFLVALFLLAFLPRALHPVSRPMQWYDRAIQFIDAVAARDWPATFQSYHPGVTTMWLTGLGMRFFTWQQALSSAQLLGDQPTKPGAVDAAIAAGVLTMALAIALSILVCVWLLRRLAGDRAAIAGGLLLALDPFHIAYSKVLHVNALLATLMFVSALALLSYLRRRRWLDLVISGAFAGLALLTKTPALFLAPYAVLATGVNVLFPARSLAQPWPRRLGTAARTLAFWSAVAAVVFVLLWPTMWVRPGEVIHQMVNWTFFHMDTHHENRVFFNGEATYGDPGPIFYAATVAWKTTAITLPMAMAALALSLRSSHRESSRARLAWLLAAYGVSFGAQMSLGSWKQIPYMVPVVPAVDVLAALGLAWIGRWIEQKSRLRWGHRLAVAPIALAVALQAAIVLPRHPYYGTHHNLLLGGSKTARRILPLQDQAEGLDLAAEVLNQLPHADLARALVHPLGAELLEHRFHGFTATDVHDPWVDYRIYTVNQVARHLGGAEWMAAWEADRQTEPLWTVAFDGVTYVWVYGEPPGKPLAGRPDILFDAHLGTHITLERARIDPSTLTPGGELNVLLVWRSDGQAEENYMVFCHLLAPDGTLVAQQDGPPIYGVRPVPSWRAGERIEDIHVIDVPERLPPGPYTLAVGMYDLETMVRLPIRVADDSTDRDHLVVDTLPVRR